MKLCDCPMKQVSATPHDAQTSSAWADTYLEQKDMPWLEIMATGDPEERAKIMDLLLAKMAVQRNRLNLAILLDRLDAEVRATDL